MACPARVEQLAAQDLGAFVQHDETDGSGKGMCRLIESITPSSATCCLFSIEATGPGDSVVNSVCFSPDMRKLGLAEGWDAVVCCAVSGLKLCRLVGHHCDVYDVAWSVDGLVPSASEDSTMKIWNPSTGECLNTLKGHR